MANVASDVSGIIQMDTVSHTVNGKSLNGSMLEAISAATLVIKHNVPNDLLEVIDSYIEKRMAYKYFYYITYDNANWTDIILNVYRSPLVEHFFFRWDWSRTTYYMTKRQHFQRDYTYIFTHSQGRF